MLRSAKASVAAVNTAIASAPAAAARSRPVAVRDEDRIADTGRPRQRREQRVGIGELGDPVRTHEAGRLDLAQPGRDERLDEATLVVGGDGRGLVLEAVARTDLVHADRAATARS